MTCSAPFIVAVVVEGIGIISSNNVSYNGSTSVAQIDTPSWQCCVPVLESCAWNLCNSWEWVKASKGSCTSHTSLGWCDAWSWDPAHLECNSWKSGGCKWSESCTTIPGIELFPAFTLSASANAVFTTNASVGIVFPVGPPTIPYEVTSLTVNSCSVTLSMNITGFPSYSGTFSVADNIVVGQQNGEFFIDIPLDSVGGTIQGTTELVTWSGDLSLLFCLDPIEGVGWLNLNIAFTMGYENVTVVCAVDCPIIEADPVPPPE